MSLVNSLAQGALALRADVGGAPAPWDDWWYRPLGSASSSGMRVTADTVKRLGTVIAAVGAKARSLAVLPCKIYTDIPGGGSRVVSNHPLYDVLYSRPNALQTAYEFKQMMQGHVELRGNAYAEIIPGRRGAVDQLIPLHPDRIKVEVLPSGKLRYQYNDPLINQTRVLMQEEVFHLREWPDVSAVGQSRIAMACDMFGVALAQQDYVAKFLKNDATPNAVITGTNFQSRADEEEYLRQFEKSGTGENRHKVKLLPPGVDIKTLGIKPAEMEMLESRKASAIEICTIIGILPHLIGVDAGKSATYASVEQFNIMHAQQTVLPMAIMWEQAIQRDLLTSDKYFAKFSLASLLRGDNATRFQAYALALGSNGPAWMCPDDVRELEDLNPLPNGQGKICWRPLNMAPLDQIPAPVSPAASGDGSGNDNIDQGAGSEDNNAANAAIQGRLNILATSSAARCVRKEASGVRKLIERQAGAYEVTEFYADQSRFITEVFQLDPMGQLAVGADCQARAQELIRMLAEEQFAEASLWIEHVASTEPSKLARLAVKGVLQ
jgi:HK97 family phage portal protein